MQLAQNIPSSNASRFQNLPSVHMSSVEFSIPSRWVGFLQEVFALDVSSDACQRRFLEACLYCAAVLGFIFAAYYSRES